MMAEELWGGTELQAGRKANAYTVPQVGEKRSEKGTERRIIMVITPRNEQEYIFAILAICGQVERRDLKEKNKSETLITRNISVLKDSGIIRRDRSSKGFLYKLKTPRGIALLDSVPELGKLYNIVTGDRTSPNTKIQKARRHKQAKAASLILMSEIPVNGALLKKPCHLGNGSSGFKVVPQDICNTTQTSLDIINKQLEYIPQNQIIKNIGPKYGYYTARAFKYEGEGTTNRHPLNVTRVVGKLISKTDIFPVYYIESSLERWAPRTEMQVTNFFLNEVARAKGIEAQRKTIARHKGGKGIFFAEEKAIPDLFREDRAWGIITPAAVYGDIYVVPPRKQNLNIFQMFIEDDFEGQIKKMLFGELGSSIREIDAFINDMPVWELISCNFRKILTARRFPQEEVGFVCYDWQKEIIKEMLPKKNITFSIFDNDTRLFKDGND